MFQGINAIEFAKQFNDSEACYRYLIDWKWGKGFSCSRCGCTESYKGRTYYYRRCKQCGYDESVTANTVFHGMKMPILKAFHMVFRLSTKKKGMSTIELGTEVGVQQKTAWLFKRKIQVAMKQDKNDKLNGRVDVDETLVGGHTKKHRGRSLEDKELVLIATEKLADGRTGNIRLQHIESFDSMTLKYAIKGMIEEGTKIRTDRLPSYRSLQNEIKNFKMISSKMGKGLEELHKQIMQFKNWLRGTHHKCSEQHLHAYLNEYAYRFNRRNIRKWIFNDVVNRMMNQVPHPYHVLRTLYAYST